MKKTQISPFQRHYGIDKKLLKKRIKVYREAREQHPERWSKDIRNWSFIEKVVLNCGKPKKISNPDLDKN